MALPMAPSMYGSRILAFRLPKEAPRLGFELPLPPPPRPFFAFLPVPGIRLTWIIARRSSGDLPHGQPDGKHQEARDFIRDEAVECPIADREIGEGIGLLHRDAQAIRERVGEPGDASTAAARVDGAHLPRGA